jgi:malonic semialdehyde reductase
MFTVKQPSKIIFGKKSASKYRFPEKCLVVTSKGASRRGWIEYLGVSKFQIFDEVESNPSIETAEKVIEKFKNSDFTHVIGVGGGSSLDVAKFSAFKLNKKKIMIPTTFGSGSEVTRISVLKVNGKKQSFHDDQLLADVAIVDSMFLEQSDSNIMKNSLIDACAQSSEGYDSKIGNYYTQFLCKKGFDLLELGIMNSDNDKIALGSLYTGLGFGNASTTLGHALSYVYSNEGYSHGHALAFTTSISHWFNKSIFYERFLKIVLKLNFNQIFLKQDFGIAADLILTDRKHLDNNPKLVTKNDIIILLEKINSGKALDKF